MSIDQAGNGGELPVQPPAHPVPQLQGPFEESMIESVKEEFDDQEVPLDAMTRRTMLLEAPSYQRIVAGRWKQKAGEKYHPLWKLVAQLSFGMHLLAQNMAISEEEVMKILQSHVDDIDGFLERTTEDFDLAQSDVQERLRCLKLPLMHVDVFDRMLEDRSFRASILDGNEKIDHVISRTKRALKDALKDVQKGFDAINVVEKYLNKLSTSWTRQTPEHEAVFVAMLGNVDGWRRAFLELHLQGNKLAGSLKKLAEVVAEMQRRAAVVSRGILVSWTSSSFVHSLTDPQARTHPAPQQSMHKKASPGRRQSQSGSNADQKPLPVAPDERRSMRSRSSQSTHTSTVPSRPPTGEKVSRGRSSRSPSRLWSSQSQSYKRTLQTDGTISSLASSQQYQAVKEVDSSGKGARNVNAGHAVELPADVPENVLRQAPVSIKNRLSMTLGLKPRDNNNSDHRISSIYYPKALGDLLKSPPLSQLALAQQSVASKTTAIRSPAHKTGGVSNYTGTDSFSPQGNPSIGLITPDGKPGPNPEEGRPESGGLAQRSARASIAEAPRGSRLSSVPNLAFTSHPEVMTMARRPTDVPASGKKLRPERKSRKESQSSLGEPGPEIADYSLETTEPGGTTPPPVSTSDAAVVHDATEPSIDDGREQATMTATESPVETAESAKGTSKSAAGAEMTAPVADLELPSRQPIDDSADSSRPKAAASSGPSDSPLDQTATATATNEPGLPPIAELEGQIPRPVERTPPAGTFELEAPAEPTFKLPARKRAGSGASSKSAVTSATISKLDDFFTLPTEQTVKPGMKPKDFDGGDFSLKPEPIRPLKLKLAKRDGKLVPVQVSGSGLGRKDVGTTHKTRTDIVAEIIENLSNTPPGSPIHARSSSSATSTNSGHPWSQRSSRSLGPPEQARPPPGPGGRPMVNPDFATAGQFEGERKQRKWSVAGSKSGWKSLLRGATHARTHSESAASPTTEVWVRPRSEHDPGRDMMTAVGKDVLWFKEDAKTPELVSSG